MRNDEYYRAGKYSVCCQVKPLFPDPQSLIPFLDTCLPLAPFLADICDKLFEKTAAVVRADPGSGKSTLLPLALMDKCGEKTLIDRNPAGKIVLLEPRRAAAVGIAARMAELLGEEIGERVGYAVRLERKVSERTMVEVLTDGLFVRRIQADPSLPGIGTVIFDEFHERSAMLDLVLAFLLDLRRMGARINILIMSATMDADLVACFLNRVEGRTAGMEVPVFDIPGSVFPVETSYRPLAGKAPLGIETAAALTKILRGEACGGEGDVLVFLPGRREIADTESDLLSRGEAGDLEILPLYGSLPLSKQREIIAPQHRKKRRIILSTNIAESALTIPGISLVVDSGYVRLERFHIPTAMNRLSLETASKVSAEQRTGRAGRLGPGRCIRLWDKADLRPETTDPEIRRIDLSGLVLECLLWGIRSPDDLPWLEAPPGAAWERGLGLLRDLGAASGENQPTELGKNSVRLGLDPRLGILCLAGKKAGCPGLACAAAALLSERLPAGFMMDDDGDFRSRLAMLRKAKTKTVMETMDDLFRRLHLPAATAREWSVEDENKIGELLAAAFPDRIAARQKPEATVSAARFRFVSGREARIAGPLENSGWLIAPEVDAGERFAFIRLAAPVSEETALEILKRQTVTETRVEWKGLVPRTVVSLRAGRLFLGEERRASTRREATEALKHLLCDDGLDVLPWTEGKAAPMRLLERIRFFAAHGGIDSNAWTSEALIHDAEEWLIPFTSEPDEGSIVTVSSLLDALSGRLGWALVPVLDRELPEVFSFPNGRKRTINYSSGEPVLSAPLQFCFGIAVHPRIMSVPIVFHLLSPANRPVQITSDIAGFWKGSWADVRKEMKGRYPKHFWPEDPQTPCSIAGKEKS